MYRTHHCNQLRAADVGQTVVLAGWVAARRDHGGVIFIDLRDREGIIQLVFNPAHDSGAHDVAANARAEFYIAAKGRVVGRSESAVNAEMATGAIEIAVTTAEILG